MVARGLLALLGATSVYLGTLVSATPINGLEEREVDDVIFSFREIFVPPDDYNMPKTLYGRTVQLDDGTLLATWYEIYPLSPNLTGTWATEKRRRKKKENDAGY